MDSKMKVLLDKLVLTEECASCFNGAKMEKIVGNKEKTNYTFYIEINSTLSIENYKEFISKLRESFDTIENVNVVFNVDNINSDLIIEYIKVAFEELSEKSPMLKLFINNKIEYLDDLKIYVDNVAELKKIEDYKINIEEFLNRAGYKDVKINLLVDEEESLKIREEIENSKVDGTNVDLSVLKDSPKQEENTPAWKKNYTPKRIETVEDPDVVLGRVIDTDVVRMDTIVGKTPLVTIEAEIFGIDVRETKTDLRIFTLKVTDRTDSMYAKIFVNGDEDTKRLSKALKCGNWYKIRGSIKEDKYSNEDVLSILDINYSDHKEVEIIDDAPIRRVELHAHTMMSQMDGVTKLDLGKHTCELIDRAIKMGYRGVAITDHSGCQAFPIAFGLVTSHNKKIENPEDKFKCLYGVELTLVDDTVNIVVKPKDYPLEGTTYVVFDTETTGFNAGGKDQMIEIGAVKICDGNIIDRFDELIDPKRPLPPKITELTCITDEMLEGKDDEETVTKRFLEWAGDLPMVAHNAKFDISFITMAMKKYNLGEFNNTVIDTLELSRALDQGFARHGLSALVKRYNVPWEEDAHHRADYDAEGTALVFHKMLQKLMSQNYKNVLDLEKLISKDEIHKFGRSYHFNAIATNKVGLKNLFKIISLANTVYLYKTPRILRSKLEELREGLLIGSGCYESEVFKEARSKEGQELTNIINFYDYVEVQPPEVYNHLIQTSDFGSEIEIQNHIRKVVEATKESGKIIVATGDVHHFKREDKIYREIIVNQKVPGGGRHPLAKSNITKIPSQHFRTTREMLEDFEFLGDDLAYEIVVTNTNQVFDMVEELEVIIDTGGIPFSPRIKSDDGKSYLDCPKVTTDMVYEKASSWYGDPLPLNIEERIAKELYGDIVYKCCKDTIMEENSSLEGEELDKEIFSRMHEIILGGFENVKEVLKEYLKKNWTEEDGELTDESLDKKLNKELGGIIGGGFDPIYLISQKLVKHSNDDGYLVGSRGSVGSSFVATMMGITEVNPLPAHYRCLKCKNSILKMKMVMN